MEMKQTLYVTDREAWRKWLEANHKSQTEVWLIYYKNGSGQPRIPYADAVEEAICFGWIDSIIQRIDDERCAQKYTPRKNSRNWSPTNYARLQKMIKAGKMTPAGLACVGKEVLRKPPKPATGIPPLLQEALARNSKAKAYFEALAPSYRRQYIGWVGSAKRDETLQKRVAQAISLLEQNRKLGSQ